MKPIDPNVSLNVELTAQEWNAVVGLLTAVEAPYRVTAPIISKLQEQLMRATDGEANVSSQD